MNRQGAMVCCPFPDDDSATKAGAALLEAGLVACANRLPGVRSQFVWQGKVEESEEVGVLFKTRTDLLEQALAKLAEIHPYDTPAVMGWHCDRVAGQTADWLAKIGSKTGG